MDPKAVRIRLENELSDMLGRHSKLSDHLRNVDRDVPLDWSEMAQFMENDEVLEALEERTRQRLEALSRALRRLDEGTYEMCGSCGGPIAPERLEILPTAVVCTKCA